MALFRHCHSVKVVSLYGGLWPCLDKVILVYFQNAFFHVLEIAAMNIKLLTNKDKKNEHTCCAKNAVSLNLRYLVQPLNHLRNA